MATGNTTLPAAGRVVRLLVGVAMLCVACGAFALACRNLAQGRVDVQSRRAGAGVTHLRGWTASLFGAGQLVLAVACSSGGLAMLVAGRTGSDRHPGSRRLRVAAGVCLGVAVLLCTVPVFVERIR